MCKLSIWWQVSSPNNLIEKKSSEHCFCINLFARNTSGNVESSLYNLKKGKSKRFYYLKPYLALILTANYCMIVNLLISHWKYTVFSLVRKNSFDLIPQMTYTLLHIIEFQNQFGNSRELVESSKANLWIQY